MKIYLDVCCLSRPFDDQRQPRVRIESEAITVILAKVDAGEWTQVASDMVCIEIDATDDTERRRRMRELLPADDDIMEVDEQTMRRARQCQVMGFKPADAVHVAAAEAANADVLLSCDDRMCRIAKRNRAKLRVSVANPVDWLREHGDDTNA